MKRNRVLLGLGDLAGYYSSLESGLRALGIDCSLVVLYPGGNDYVRATRQSGFPGLMERLGLRRISTRPTSPARWALRGCTLALMPAFLFWSMSRFDTFVFGGGTTFLPRGLDLPLLKLFGKRVIVVFHGSDSRPPMISGSMTGARGPVDVERLATRCRRVKRLVARIESWADVVVDHTLSAQYHTKPFVRWLSIGVPTRAAATGDAAPSQEVRRSIRIVHAPSAPEAKGTPIIEAAIERLRQRGYQIEFIKLVGRTNSEVLETLRTADFAVDELYSDVPLARFGSEAAAAGIPTVVGMYGFDALQRHTPEKNRIPPAHVCHPDHVEKAIEELIADPEMRRALGSRAKSFVHQEWSPLEVAQRFARLFAEDFPRDWLFAPEDIEYVHGAGLHENRLRDVIRALLAARGPDALQLDDAKLRHALVDLVRRECAPTDISAAETQTSQAYRGTLT